MRQLSDIITYEHDDQGRILLPTPNAAKLDYGPMALLYQCNLAPLRKTEQEWKQVADRWAVASKPCIAPTPFSTLGVSDDDA